MQAIVEAALASVTIASQSVPKSIRQAKPPRAKRQSALTVERLPSRLGKMVFNPCFAFRASGRKPDSAPRT